MCYILKNIYTLDNAECVLPNIIFFQKIISKLDFDNYF